MIRKEFLTQSKIPFAPKGEAAAVLVGHVNKIWTEPIGYRTTSETIQGKTYNYEITNSRWLIIELDAKLMDRKTGKIVWSVNNMREKATYSVSSDPLKTQYNQRRATEKIAKLLAQRFYLKTMERF